MQKFLFHILLKAIMLGIISIALVFFALQRQIMPMCGFALLWIISIWNLYYYATRTNRTITRFFEAIQYDDFNIKFQIDSKLGKSFEGLNIQLNHILHAFRQARAEKEASLHYLNNIVQHINVGIMSIDTQGNVGLLNQTALKLLGVYQLKHLNDLREKHPILHKKLQHIAPHKKTLYEASPEKQLAIHTTHLTLRGQKVLLISFQNILDELQQKELESWQNLTKILRHEIMNSVAPIVSLIGTMKEIVKYDMKEKSPATADLEEALETIESRGRGVMNFVNAYREFTAIPKPRLQEIDVQRLIDSVGKLFATQAQTEHINFTITIAQNFKVLVDIDQLAQVLINLLKNAFEATEKQATRHIYLTAHNIEGKNTIAIKDNGAGIEPEAIEKIFMPFYSTKPRGSGIGLSLSYQIMRLHQGQLKVQSEVGKGSTFLVIFAS